MPNRLSLIDPPEMHTSPAFAQGTIVPAGRTIYVGGQNGIDSSGRLSDGIEAQTVQALKNVLAVLAAAQSGPEHVAKLTIYVTSGVDVRQAFAASARVWGSQRTAITVLIVAGLALPNALIEVEAVALIP
ncbi:RidA family protein [Kocuria marina]|uniref:RidA family protein n=1 Tax=Kocuria marina TaxID=223184 RepID=UPI002989D7DC|nr:RidA family protein [Kocuria marina]MCT1734848.1 RidA family protein [Kocuria marina]